jgi:predicted metalloprotease with PDZ domain
MPFRLDRRNHTRLLWVFEGITSYYQELFLVRSGLLGVDAFLRRLGELLTRVYRIPGRMHQSLADSSFNAWDHLYKPEANNPNASVSYYSKGALVALTLDLMLRRDSTVSLDDIVLELWRRFGSRDIGLPEDGFEALVAELAGPAFRDTLRTMVYGTDDPDLASLMNDFGLGLRWRQSEGPKDAGGTPPGLTSPRLGLGVVFEAAGPGLKLNIVLDGQPAQAAGLAPGDIIVALDRIQASAESLGERLSRYAAGDDMSVSYFRGDELRETVLRLAPEPADYCYIELSKSPGPEALGRRRAWLRD